MLSAQPPRMSLQMPPAQILSCTGTEISAGNALQYRVLQIKDQTEPQIPNACISSNSKGLQDALREIEDSGPLGRLSWDLGPQKITGVAGILLKEAVL